MPRRSLRRTAFNILTAQRVFTRLTAEEQRARGPAHRYTGRGYVGC